MARELITVDAGERLTLRDQTIANKAGAFCILSSGDLLLEGCIFASLTPVHCIAGRVVLRDCVLMFGKPDDNQHHGLYAYPPVDVLVDNCRFVAADKTSGFGVHIYGPGDVAGRATIRDSEFSGARAVLTNPKGPTALHDCTFNKAQVEVQAGNATLDYCRFADGARVISYASNAGQWVLRDCVGLK